MVMNKRIMRIIILAAVFVGALIGFYIILNHRSTGKGEEMEHATFPVVYVQENGQMMNELHGYASDMSAVSMRDTITPLPDNNVLQLKIRNYGETIRDVSYRLKSLDDSRTIGEGKAQKITTDKGMTTVSMKLSNNTVNSSDYILIIQVKIPGKTLNYYTRTARFTDAHFADILKFVENVHDLTLKKSQSAKLYGAMEPSAGSDATSLNEVSINSTLSQISWADFDHREVTRPYASVKELTNSYTSIVLNYIVSHEENGVMEYYNVSEYYRARYDAGKIYLLNFNRSMSRIFRGNADAGKSYINLGIRDKNVNYMANKTGNIFCFVQEGELWSYDTDQNRFTRVFSFHNSDEMDIRENYDQHDIKIIRIDETGCIDFIVYGYMNAGAHEGQVGISVCHYDVLSKTVQELLFIPQKMSYQQLKQKIGTLMYVSSDSRFYFAAGNRVYEMNLKSRRTKVLISSLGTDYQVSDNGRYVAWTDANKSRNATRMHITDLENGKTTDVRAPASCSIRPLGFLGTDCIYGTAQTADLQKAQSGQDIFPMNRVYIMEISGSQHKLIKTYDAGKQRFSAARISSAGTITLQKVTYKKDTYVEKGTLSIQNSELVSQHQIGVSYITSDTKEQEVVLSLKNKVPKTKASILTPLLSVQKDSDTIEIGNRVFQSSYYVYAQGKVILATQNTADAVKEADSAGGVVVDHNQNYIWNRAKMLSQNAITLQKAGGKSTEARAVNTMLTAMGTSPSDTDAALKSGKTPYDILKAAQKGGQILDLTGCSLDEVLYYIGRGYPVYTRISSSHPVLLVGYDSSNVTYYDPADAKTTTGTLKAVSKKLKAAGNIFLAYQRQT